MLFIVYFVFFCFLLCVAWRAWLFGVRWLLCVVDCCVLFMFVCGLIL